jgi:hypothetical protein
MKAVDGCGGQTLTQHKNMRRIEDFNHTLSAVNRVLRSPNPEMIGRVPGGASLYAVGAYRQADSGRLVSDVQAQELHALTGFYAPKATYQQEAKAYGKLELEALRQSTLCLRQPIEIKDEDTYKEIESHLEGLVEDYMSEIHVWTSDAIHAWVPLLEGLRVLVVSAFTDTMEAQWSVRNLLHTTNDWNSAFCFPFPKFDIQFVKAPLTVEGCEPFKHASWHDAFADLCRSVEGLEFDIALMSCGSYAQPLAAHIYNLGKSSWVVGGILQTVFGIKGHRWERGENPIRGYYNDHWVYPSKAETPLEPSQGRPPWDTFWKV